jgi:micrococcal nuclease
MACFFRSPRSLLRASALLLSGAIFPGAAAALPDCGGEDGGSSLVSEIRGGDTLILQDGRSVRLSGALLPRKMGDSDMASKAREEAEKLIAELVAGQVVQLRLDAPQRDRYGRVMAQIFVAKGEDRVWVQEKLIAGGFARTISSKDNRACTPALLAAEKVARDTGQGHWRTGLFAVRPAASEDVLAGLAQSYEIVEGQVENVAEVRGRIYLNFGRNWRRDFTATISADALKLFTAEPGSLAALKGKTVRVRGWLENMNGPSVNVTHPEQIEQLTSGTAAR